MINLDALAEAFHLLWHPDVFFWIITGVAIGVTVGAIPGLTATMGIALMLPISFALPVASALGLVIGLYKGAAYGGSISAISFGVPGVPASAATIYDGYKLMQKGQGRKANEMALTASVTADSLSDIFTIVVAPAVALAALAFGPSERFWLLIIAIALIGALTGTHLAKGLISATIGLFVAMIGSEPMSMVSRMTFGQWWLMDGIPLIPFMIGIFALPPILLELSKFGKKVIVQKVKAAPWKTGAGLTFKEYWSCRKEMGIGTAVGTFVGMLPGLGATPGAFLSYGLAKQASPQKEIGTGKLEGVAAPEAGNNATCGPTLIPLLALGIPGSPAAALIGAALMLQGATPSPLMFGLYPHIIYALFMILLVANVFNLGIGWLVLKFYVVIGQLPKSILFPLILMLAIIGTYASRMNPYDIFILLSCALLGFGMVIAGIPSAPMVIAFILGPMIEENLRRSLQIHQGAWTQALFSSPLSLGLIVTAVVAIFFIVRLISKGIKMGGPEYE